jgi:hypothetical protein
MHVTENIVKMMCLEFMMDNPEGRLTQETHLSHTWLNRAAKLLQAAAASGLRAIISFDDSERSLEDAANAGTQLRRLFR